MRYIVNDIISIKKRNVIPLVTDLLNNDLRMIHSRLVHTAACQYSRTPISDNSRVILGFTNTNIKLTVRTNNTYTTRLIPNPISEADKLELLYRQLPEGLSKVIWATSKRSSGIRLEDAAIQIQYQLKRDKYIKLYITPCAELDNLHIL